MCCHSLWESFRFLYLAENTFKTSNCVERFSRGTPWSKAHVFAHHCFLPLLTWGVLLRTWPSELPSKTLSQIFTKIRPWRQWNQTSTFYISADESSLKVRLLLLSEGYGIWNWTFNIATTAGLLRNPWRHGSQDRGSRRGRFLESGLGKKGGWGDECLWVSCGFQRYDLVSTPGLGGRQPVGIPLPTTTFTKLTVFRGQRGYST